MRLTTKLPEDLSLRFNQWRGQFYPATPTKAHAARVLIELALQTLAKAAHSKLQRKQSQKPTRP